MKSIVIATVFLLASCAGAPIHGYLWVPDPLAPACERMDWHTLPPKDVHELCGGANHPACVVGRCQIASIYTEEQAHREMQWGESVYDHEARHVFKRLKHPYS